MAEALDARINTRVPRRVKDDLTAVSRRRRVEESELARTLLDEALRREKHPGCGLDAESILTEHPDLIGVADPAVLARAASLGRTVVTDNVRHFLPLHEAYLAEHRIHAGLLLAHPRWRCRWPPRVMGVEPFAASSDLGAQQWARISLRGDSRDYPCRGGVAGEASGGSPRRRGRR